MHASLNFSKKSFYSPDQASKMGVAGFCIIKGGTICGAKKDTNNQIVSTL